MEYTRWWTLKLACMNSIGFRFKYINRFRTLHKPRIYFPLSLNKNSTWILSGFRFITKVATGKYVRISFLINSHIFKKQRKKWSWSRRRAYKHGIREAVGNWETRAHWLGTYNITCYGIASSHILACGTRGTMQIYYVSFYTRWRTVFMEWLCLLMFYH